MIQQIYVPVKKAKMLIWYNIDGNKSLCHNFAFVQNMYLIVNKSSVKHLSGAHIKTLIQ